MYIALKWLHVAGIAIGLGSNVTHVFWLIAAGRDPAHRANILRLVKKIDDRLAVPAWVAAVVAGIAMWLWRWPVNTPWIVASVVLTTVLAVMGIVFGPFMYRWIDLARAHGVDGRRLALWSKRLTAWWIGIVVTAFVVLYLMVFRPVLW